MFYLPQKLPFWTADHNSMFSEDVHGSAKMILWLLYKACFIAAVYSVCVLVHNACSMCHMLCQSCHLIHRINYIVNIVFWFGRLVVPSTRFMVHRMCSLTKRKCSRVHGTWSTDCMWINVSEAIHAIAPPLLDLADGVKILKGKLPNGKAFSVQLDNASHPSAVQRAYCKCSLHENCQKYRMVNQDLTPTHTMAWITAWLFCGYFKGDHIDAKEHIHEVTPTDADVASALIEFFPWVDVGCFIYDRCLVLPMFLVSWPVHNMVGQQVCREHLQWW